MKSTAYLHSQCKYVLITSCLIKLLIVVVLVIAMTYLEVNCIIKLIILLYLCNISSELKFIGSDWYKIG